MAPHSLCSSRLVRSAVGNSSRQEEREDPPKRKAVGRRNQFPQTSLPSSTSELGQSSLVLPMRPFPVALQHASQGPSLSSTALLSVAGPACQLHVPRTTS